MGVYWRGGDLRGGEKVLGGSPWGSPSGRGPGVCPGCPRGSPGRVSEGRRGSCWANLGGQSWGVGVLGVVGVPWGGSLGGGRSGGGLGGGSGGGNPGVWVLVGSGRCRAF